MALKKKSGKEKSSKLEKGPKPKKDRGGNRKEFILDQVRNAGSGGIKVSAIIKATDKKFDYDEGGSRMRVSNSLRSAKEDGLVSSKEGVYFWKGKKSSSDKKKDKSDKKKKSASAESESSDDEA